MFPCLEKQGGGDKSIYPHWNMEEGQSATLRFLPDSNTKTHSSGKNEQ